MDKLEKEIGGNALQITVSNDLALHPKAATDVKRSLKAVDDNDDDKNDGDAIDLNDTDQIRSFLDASPLLNAQAKKQITDAQTGLNYKNSIKL